jgi:hypothetical protein
MIVVNSVYVSKKDTSMLKKYARFVLNRFVRRSILNKANINIKIISKDDCGDICDADDLGKYRAWCTYDKVIDGKKYFTVVLNAKSLSKAKTPHIRLKNMLIDLGHELVHIKQYLNSEIFDYKSGDVRYKGTYFEASCTQDEESYYDSPWEVEAYGRELGLYRMFVTKLKEESSKK